MTTAQQIRKRLAAFRDWLIAHGASMLEPTNEWELVRFSGDSGLSIAYSSKRGTVTFTGEAGEAWRAFTDGREFRIFTPTKRRKVSGNPTIRALRRRDGNLCFFCQRYVSEENQTVEHLVPVVHGGPNHMSNYVLAHGSCNQKQGHKDAPSKIREHIKAALELEIDRFLDGGGSDLRRVSVLSRGISARLAKPGWNDDEKAQHRADIEERDAILGLTLGRRAA